MSSLLVSAGIVLVLGVLAQWMAWRLRVPAILLLLATGFVVGPIGIDILDVDQLLGDLLVPIIGISVAIILFEGGLGLRFSEIGAHGKAVARLVTVGAIITGLIGTVGARYLLELPWDLSALLGSILIVSGPTVILPLLRHVRPDKELDAVLRWEGILVDSIGAVAAVLVFEFIRAGTTQQGLTAVMVGLGLTIGIGLLIGLLFGLVLMQLERRFWVPDYLSGAVGLALVVGAYIVADLIYAESGLVTVTAMGVYLANQRRANIRHLVDFKEDLSQVLLGSLFILLAARLQPSALDEIQVGAILFLAVLIFVARPLTVLASTVGSRLTLRHRVFLAWMAPRGIVAAAVSAFFALRLEELGRPEAAIFVPVTFLVIIGTVVLYGLTSRPLARRLGVGGVEGQGVLLVGINQFSRQLAGILKEEGYPTLLVDASSQAVQAARVDGMDAIKGNPVSLHFADRLDLAGFNTLWAMTASRESNALASMRYADDFGRARVFQLPVIPPDPEEEMESHMRGRYLFGRDLVYADYRNKLQSGWELRRTPITESFRWRDYRSQHPKAIPLLLMGGHRLQPWTDEYAPEAVPGTTVLSLVPSPEPKKPEVP